MLRVFAVGLLALNLFFAVTDAAMSADIDPKFIECPKFTKNVSPPPYPREAYAQGRDGWVFLELTVTPDGSVHDAAVLDSYPKGVFDQAALDAAPSWKFTPGRYKGEPTPMRFQFNVTFYMEQLSKGVSPHHGRVFEKTFKALAARTPEAAAENLEQMRQLFEAQKLNIAEAARYHAFLTTYKRLTGDFAGTLETSQRAILLARYLDNPRAADVTHQERIASYLGLGRYDEAVDYFDTWRKKSETRPTQQLVDLIEKLRAGGAGKGQVFSIFNYAELDSAPEK